MTQAVEQADDPGEEVRRLWTGRGPIFEEVRERLATMGRGRSRCMYCEDNEGTDIDHFYPRGRYPLRAFLWLNLLLSCSGCNRRKAATFPLDESNTPLLIDPTSDDPRSDITFTPSTGRYIAQTQRGTTSLEVFRLNRELLARGRCDAWVAIQALIAAYAAHRRRGADERASELADVIARHAFSAVFVEIVAVYDTPRLRPRLSEACRRALADYPEVRAVA
jgi:uncharacterized protein (TIGR02646 family)